MTHSTMTRVWLCIRRYLDGVDVANLHATPDHCYFGGNKRFPDLGWIHLPDCGWMRLVSDDGLVIEQLPCPRFSCIDGVDTGSIPKGAADCSKCRGTGHIWVVTDGFTYGAES